MMRITLPLLLALPFLLSSCGGNSPKGKMKQILGKMDEIADILENVDDEDAAEDAADELKGLIKEIDELGDELKKMRKDLDDDEMEELEEELSDDLESIRNRLRKEVAGLMATDYGQKELAEVLREIDM